jgi:hypothetical protein
LDVEFGAIGDFLIGEVSAGNGVEDGDGKFGDAVVVFVGPFGLFE